MTRNQIKADMDRLGKWREFVAYRTAATQLGMAPKDARVHAYQRVMAELQGAPPPPAPAVQQQAGGVETTGDLSGQGSPPTAPPSAPPPPAFNPFGMPLISKERVAEIFGKRKRPTQNQEDEWVENNIDVAVDLEDAPSIAAWSRLVRLRTSPDLMRDFFRGRMQIRSLKQEEDSKRDNGSRTDAELIARVLHALKRSDGVLSSGAEGFGGEPEVSGEGDNAGP